MTLGSTDNFKQTVWDYYYAHQRNLPWRNCDYTRSQLAYRVLVSEIMLQQTQVTRVIEKFELWMQLFPVLDDVANASLADILTAWSGLGYNRRARFLHEACKQVVQNFGGSIPLSVEELVTLPGIGANTAGAIVAYAYNLPTIFIETNIRTVYIHYFFPDSESVSDNSLRPILAQTVDVENPREWYWALMDYGTYLKKEVGNVSRQSKHHVAQSKFIGSKRQVRGEIIRQLIDGPKDIDQLILAVNNDERLHDILEAMLAEGLINKTGVIYKLPS
jgi:A/G-specific adenine glycosylase